MCCREELFTVRTELEQILQVPASGPLVHGGIELEADHVEVTCEPGDEAAIVASIEAPDEAVRKAKIKQRIGTEVDPVTRKAEGARHVDNRDPKGFGHRAHGLDPVGCPLAEKIEILRGGPRHKPAQDEVATPIRTTS